MRKSIGSLIAAIGGLIMAAASVSPENAVSNLAAWAKSLGVNDIPPWLVTPSTDNWGFIVGAVIFSVSIAITFWQRRRYPITPKPNTASNLSESRAQIDKPDRLPLVDFLNDSRRLGWDIDGQTSIELLDLVKEIRQAALDETIGFWGKLADSQFDDIVRRKPLEKISCEHWRNFEIDAIGWREAKDNFHARTYNPRQSNWGSNSYADLHVDRKVSLDWLDSLRNPEK